MHALKTFIIIALISFYPRIQHIFNVFFLFLFLYSPLCVYSYYTFEILKAIMLISRLGYWLITFISVLFTHTPLYNRVYNIHVRARILHFFPQRIIWSITCILLEFRNAKSIVIVIPHNIPTNDGHLFYHLRNHQSHTQTRRMQIRRSHWENYCRCVI